MATDTVYSYTPYSEMTPDQKRDLVDQRRIYGSDKVAQMTEDAKILTAVTGMKHSARSVIPLVNEHVSGLRVPTNVQVLCSREWNIPGCTDYTSEYKLRVAQTKAVERRQNASV